MNKHGPGCLLLWVGESGVVDAIKFQMAVWVCLGVRLKGVMVTQ